MEMDGRNADDPAVAIAGGEEALNAGLSSGGEAMVVGCRANTESSRYHLTWIDWRNDELIGT